MPKKVVVLGSTGSIGQQTLENISAYGPEKWQVLAIAGGKNLHLLEKQVAKYNPRYVVVGDESLKNEMRHHLGFSKCTVLWGMKGLETVAEMPEADLIIQALGGAVGICPTIAAIKAGKRIGLANKETLVAAGDLVMSLSIEYGAQIIPVDSEHSAIFQCLQGELTPIFNLWLTASGGPFYRFSIEDLEKVTVENALKHPRWTMGPKITIDSATLMNKGLEVIEAHHLFNIPYENINVLVHPESAIHSMIETVDGALIAQLGVADMRLPIQYAFSWPKREKSLVKRLNLADLGTLHFELPDTKKFPSLKMAYEVGKTGGSLPALMNAANEEAVAAFLAQRIGFRDIFRVTNHMVELHSNIANPSLDEILAIDLEGRKKTKEYLKTL